MPDHYGIQKTERKRLYGAVSEAEENVRILPVYAGRENIHGIGSAGKGEPRCDREGMGYGGTE